MHPAFEPDVPYVVLLVELDEGPRLLGRPVTPFEPSAGAAVEVVVYDVDGTKLVGFRCVA
jgi:uncharacterized OB-fold protein